MFILFLTMHHPKIGEELNITIEQFSIESEYLERTVLFDAYFPTDIKRLDLLSLLLINDGQDLIRMDFQSILNKLVSNEEIQPLFCIGIHCGADRFSKYSEQIG